MVESAMAETMNGAGEAEAGFTLVEVLVSLALVALLSLLLLQGAWTATRMSRRLADSERQATVQAVRDHLRRTLGDAVAAIGAGRSAAFAGGPDRLLLVTDSERLIEVGGQMRVHLGIAPGATGLDLVEARGLDRGVRAEAARPEPLLRGIAGWSLRYYGRRGPTPLATWGESWDVGDRLPLLVSVTVAFPQGDPRLWSPLAVPIAVAR
ncbi:MAG TPA: prepilin-type N-terminal cleavage/methylation domain-containing protein [Methylobacterium sp.]|jgi:general secretion pathway protein J|nr:prepilin-type N-terminal cleavage/methylation domain-containing protein [Methylobacterium sp.]